MNGQPPILPAAATRYAKRVQAMIDDPDCNGDLLAIGLALAAMRDLKTIPSDWDAVANAALGKSRRRYAFRDAIRSDVRRYDVDSDPEAGSRWGGKCGAPMQRREGPCGQQSTRRSLITDPDTGRQQWLSACTRHADWFTAEAARHKKAASGVEPIDPPANTGGVLERHLPELKWDKIYRWARPDWQEPGERVERPKLVVIKGGAA